MREKIKDHAGSLNQNETRTRTVLVDPLLTVLGWDVANPKLVTIEYPLAGKSVDYALIGPENSPNAIVEAKKLNTNLSDHSQQVVTYANIGGIKYAVITNGDSWELYDVFKQVQWTDKRVMQVNISSMSSAEVALNLLMMWRSNLSTGTVSEVKRPQLHPVEELKPNQKEHKPSSGWIPLTDFDPPSKTKPPTLIRFWDNTEVSIEKWHDLYIQIVKKCFESGYLTTQMLPIGTSKTNYVSTSNKHPDGLEMKQFKLLSNSPLVIETWMSAQNSRNRSKNLLKRCGLDPFTVLVKNN
ncbi:MAG: type I restriction enzyme HsdR N-terminal domain-containing protein [Gammaproteobacteria bacterium]|nr:type I restriction enzyme HsdR N-terminal domain-containing protein [Gammaproteobacteria bacterium]